MRAPRRTWRALALASWVALAAGCGSSPPTRLHLLSAPPGAPASAPLGATVGVGPVTVPEYLDRLQLVAREDAGSLVVSDTQRWAEPLREGLARVLAESLAASLAGERVARFPWPRAQAPELRVPVEVLRFEPGPDAAVHLEARWWVARGDGGPVLPPRVSRIAVPCTGDIADRVRAHGEAAARLAGEIAAALPAAQR